ncbi:pirin-related protein [Vibrio sp. RC586]|nr:pirin-related protein [Vibrio sp. RC586]
MEYRSVCLGKIAIQSLPFVHNFLLLSLAAYHKFTCTPLPNYSNFSNMSLSFASCSFLHGFTTISLSKHNLSWRSYMIQDRQIRQLVPVQPTSDGDGVKIQRIAGFQRSDFSPFLMLDELKADSQADYIGGFPPHPHRGIETLTYMLQGHFQHRDHMGNVGELRSGGAQWMSAGRGVIHSEMPIMQEGQLHGFQIWINQPARNKMSPAKYHDFQPENLAEHSHPQQGLIRVIAGSITLDTETITGPLTNTGVPLTVADWRAEANQQMSIYTPETFNAMVYVYRGQLTLGNHVVKAGEMAMLSTGERLTIRADQSTGCLLLMGEPINEPVVHYGPFVMNSMAEIEQAIRDYNAGHFETY